MGGPKANYPSVIAGNQRRHPGGLRATGSVQAHLQGTGDLTDTQNPDGQ